ncbi:hypothetical protein F9K33_03495 [bacterium]|nr:MAG: hypothetical protein F9K33_03495 [bacterium]
MTRINIFFVAFSMLYPVVSQATQLKAAEKMDTAIFQDSIVTSAADYVDIIKKIAWEIELLKDQYPQLRDFESSVYVDANNLSISYGYKTHRAVHQSGWTSGVPNPDDDGIWLYIDFHSPKSTKQIHTQPKMPALCIGEMQVSFLILEGDATPSIAPLVRDILKNNGIIKC